MKQCIVIFRTEKAESVSRPLPRFSTGSFEIAEGTEKDGFIVINVIRIREGIILITFHASYEAE